MQWENGPEGGCPDPPFPQQPSRPLGGRAPPGPRTIVLLSCFSSSFLFLANFARAPAARHLPPPRSAGGLGPAPLYPQRSGSRRTPRSRTGSAGEGGAEGAPEPATPSASQTAACPPRGPGGRGRGMGALRLPWRGPGTRNRGPGIAREPAAERGGDRQGSGRGAGARGARSRAPPPGCSRRRAPPAAAPIVCGPALPGAAAPRPAGSPRRAGPRRPWNQAAARRPRPRALTREASIPCQGPTRSPSLPGRLFPTRR